MSQTPLHSKLEMKETTACRITEGCKQRRRKARTAAVGRSHLPLSSSIAWLLPGARAPLLWTASDPIIEQIRPPAQSAITHIRMHSALKVAFLVCSTLRIIGISIFGIKLRLSHGTLQPVSRLHMQSLERATSPQLCCQSVHSKAPWEIFYFAQLAHS